MPESLPIMKGMLDMLVLRALRWTPMHGFQIVSWLEDQSRDRLEIEDSAVYQALYRLEERGLVAAEWGTTENNRRARYYKLTPAGSTRLRTETERWASYSRAVTEILGAARRPAR
ncbi:MAG TPA: PadR family transcriptional regulator [Gemmatimonadaceae bacterium]|jgi:PadR family transcriptional regulator PadR|nr:PadR family transcriptional regulator [Gemmatimonadaceae bacterium]